VNIVKNTVQHGHGETAPREAGLLPWSEIAVDMIDPWTLEISDRTEKFSALTIIYFVMNIPLMSDLTLVQQNRQRLTDQRLIESNCKRFAYDYQPNQEVLKLEYKPDKLTPHVTGLYRITSLHTNGTITIQLTPHTRQGISIRNVKLFLQ
jgi:hypothetical protein